MMRLHGKILWLLVGAVIISFPARGFSIESENVVREKVQAVVTVNYTEGYPYEYALELAKMSTHSVPIMIEMLQDEKYGGSWPTIAFFLGMMRDERAVEPLIEFVEKHSRRSEVLTWPNYLAIEWALMGLGEIGTEKSLVYLIDAIESDKFSKDVKCRWGRYTQSESINDFRAYAVIGLGHSGNKKGLEKLTLLLTKPAYKEFFPYIRDAIKVYHRINKHGYEDVHTSIYDPGGYYPDPNKERKLRHQIRKESNLSASESMEQMIQRIQKAPSDKKIESK